MSGHPKTSNGRWVRVATCGFRRGQRKKQFPRAMALRDNLSAKEELQAIGAQHWSRGAGNMGISFFPAFGSIAFASP
jgi:hypothetical protein